MIYTITRFRENPTQDKMTPAIVVGYYTDKETAVQRVLNNYNDLHEAGYYKYIVIEEFGQGIHTEAWDSMLFELIDRKWTHTNTLDMTNFAMG